MKVIRKIGLLVVMLVFASGQIYGQVSFNMPKEYNYNIINSNDNTLRNVEIQNISDQVLEFTASSTCTSCFEKIEITPKSIKPKEVTKLFFKYDKNRIGVFSKTIKITCSNGEMFYFPVKGEIVVGSEQDNRVENSNSIPKQLTNSSTKNSNVPKTTQQNTNVKSKSEPKQTTSSNNTAKKYMFPFMEKRTWDSKSDIIKIEQQKNLTLVTFLFINQGYGTWSINLPGQDKPDIAFYITDKKTGRIYKTLEKESPLFKIDKGWFIITDVQFEKVPDDVKVFDLYTGDPDKNPKNAHFYNITLSEPEDMQNGINLNRILELKNTYDNTNVPLDNSEKEFYISNAKRSNVYTTPRGWQYEILQTGNGDIVNYNDEKVKLNANNCFSFKSERSKQFEKNKTFNSSFETSDYFIRTGRDCGANNAFEIPYHPNRFIPDQQAILQMHVGDKWKLFYPTYKYTNFTGNEIRVEKEIEVLEIIKAKKPIKKEIEIKNDQIFYLKGDGLNFTEALFQSETYNLENVNVFVIGQIKNTTEKTLKVQTIVNYNYAQTSGAYIFNSTDIQKIPTSFYDILQPGETKGFVTHLKLKRKSQGTNAYHYTADLDKKNPYSIETKIVTSIPQENIKSQNELITALQKNGNVPVKKTDWEEFFKKSDANIQAKNTEEKKTDSKSKSIKTESSNKISIEFREIKTNKENCGGFSYRLFDVYKNGKNYKTLKVVSHNDEWWSSCPFDCMLCRKLSKSKYSLKQFLIYCHEGDAGKADNYILTEL